MTRVLVEGFDRDAVVLARMLTREGHRVTLAGPATRRSRRSSSARRASMVRARADLDTDPGHHDEAFLDVWTPEVAPRVALLRESGAASSAASATSSSSARPCPRSASPGPPGRRRRPRSSRTSCAAPGSPCIRARRPARRTCGRPPSSSRRRPTASVVMELTSSHLCFTTRSPTIAVITCFWPDHLELHGSLERYRAAKEAIVRGQGPDDIVVANERRPGRGGDRRPLGRAAGSASRRRSEVEAGAFVQRQTRRPARRRPASARSACRRASTPRASRRCSPPPRRRIAVGALPEELRLPEAPAAPRDPRRPPRRDRADRRRHGGDAGEDRVGARTATPDDSVVLVAGGELESAGLAVHASPRGAGAARAGLCRGAAGRPPRRPLRPRRRRGSRRSSTAGERSARRASTTRSRLASTHAEGASVLVVSPMFPLPLADRERIAPALEALAAAGNSALILSRYLL